MNPRVGDDTELDGADWSAESELGRVLDAYLRAIEAGEPLDPDTLAAAHPRIAKRFLACIPVLKVSAQLAGAEAPLDPAAGVQLGDFVLIRKIGQGGMGTVFEARQAGLDRPVALKTLPFASALDPDRLARFQIEARAAAQLHHTNIVPIISIGCERGVHFYAMQLIEGRTVSVLIRDLREAGGPAADRFRLTAELGLQAAEALEHAHCHGVVHRDVKPANLMVDLRNNLWITDFGLARMSVDSDLTFPGDVLGTLRYMSPEQSSGDRSRVDHRTDVYSLGATLYELATLQPVHPAADRDELRRNVAAGEPRRPRSVDRSIPRDLETILLRSLSRDRDQRYPTAGAMADDLRRFLEHRPILARRPSPWRRFERWTRRHKALSAALAFALLLAVVGGGVIAALAFRNHDLDRSHRRLDQIQRHSGYVRDVALAGQYVQLNRLDEAVALLSRYVPAPGAADERGFPWHYLWRLCHLRPQRLRGHAGDVYHVEYAPDGKTLVTCGQDGTVRTWDAATGAPLRTFCGHAGDVDWAAFSPDGKTLASCGDDGTVRLWNPLDEKAPPIVLGRHEKESVSVVFSPDGRTLFSGDDLGRIKAWDVAARREKRAFPSVETRVESLACSPDGRTLAVATLAGLWRFDVEAPDLKTRVAGFGSLLGVAFSHNGRTMAGGEWNGPVRLRTEKDGATVEKILNSGPSGHAYGLAFSPDDRVLAVSHREGLVCLWDVESGARLRSYRTGPVRNWGAAFAPDGRKLAVCGAEAKLAVWDARDVQDCQTVVLPEPLVATITPALNRGAFTAACSRGRGDVVLKTWDFFSRSMRPAPDYGFNEPIRGAVSPDGSRAVVHLGEPPWTRVVSLREEASLPPLEGMDGFPSAPEAFGGFATPAFSPDGARLAARVWPGWTCVWDLSTGRLIGEPCKRAAEFAFSPNGDRLALASDGGLDVWDLTTGKHREYPGSGFGTGIPIVFTPDGRKVIVGYPLTRFAAAWNLDALDARPTVWELDHGPFALAVSPDGATLAAGSEDGKITLVDLPSLQPILTLEAPSPHVQRLQFSSDGSTLLAATYLNAPAAAPPAIAAWTFARSAEKWLGTGDFRGR